MSRTPEYLAADLELWADRIEDGHIFITPDEMNCASVMRLAAQLLAQPEQEPVAYIKAAELEELKHCNGMSLWAENAAIHTEDSISKQLLPSGHVPVYTTPPQRTWVGLTPENYNWIFEQARTGEHAVQLAEAKLKEKNT